MVRVSKQKRTAEALRTMKRNHRGQHLSEYSIKTYIKDAVKKVGRTSGSTKRSWELLNQVGGIRSVMGHDGKYELTDINPNDILTMDMDNIVNLDATMTFDDIEAAKTEKVKTLKENILKDMKGWQAKVKVTEDLDALELIAKLGNQLFKN